MNHNEFKLSTEIIALSVADTWEVARSEWIVEDVFKEDEPDTCLCGHYPINEMCYLRNRLNRNRALVGNICVKKFLGLPSDRIFSSVYRITKDPGLALSAEAILHARDKKWISDWEYQFYDNTFKKRQAGMSQKQLDKRVEINQRVLRKIQNARVK